MPKYLVERRFGAHASIFADTTDRERYGRRAAINAEAGVTWLHSYLSSDHRRSFCVVEAADPESVRKASALSGLPVTAITRVSVVIPRVAMCGGPDA